MPLPTIAAAIGFVPVGNRALQQAAPAFTAWGQTDLLFEQLTTPYQRLGNTPVNRPGIPEIDP